MALKPINKRHPLETREAVWEAIRQLREFTIKDLRYATRLGADTIRDYLIGLTAAGYLEKSPPAPLSQRGEAINYTLVKDCGVDAPRVRKDGSEFTMGKSREQMWLVLKVLGEFSAKDLAFNATTEEVEIAVEDARNYLMFLHKAGYLTIVTPGRPGHRKGTGAPTIYRLIPSMYTGPRPPMVQRVKQVYDPNLRKVVWSGGDE